MMPPTSIDGTDISGATIDGTDVTEITVDGNTVFTAETLPVAYSNLIAWYPFDSGEYGGSDTDDVTALFNSGQSGDSTAFDLTSSGSPTFPSSGGVTDINAGATSGAVDFSGQSGAGLTNTSLQLDDTDDFTVTGWAETVSGVDTSTAGIVGQRDSFSSQDWSIFNEPGNGAITATAGESNATGTLQYNVNYDGNYAFFAFVKNGNDYQLYGGSGTSPVDSTTFTGGWTTSDTFVVGNLNAGGTFTPDGAIDDVRVYNTALTGTQIDQIYTNTEP